MEQPSWKTVWLFLTKLNRLLPYDSAILLLGIYPMVMKTHVRTKLTSASFIITKSSKQPRHSSVGERTSKLGYIWRMEYHSALKKPRIKHGGNLIAFYYVKEAKLKKWYIIWSQLDDILEKAKLQRH